MKKNSLPKHILVALQLKRQVEVVWKSLSSSNESSPDSVATAEVAFNEQASHVDSLFFTLRSIDRSKMRAACTGRSCGANRTFWG